MGEELFSGAGNNRNLRLLGPEEFFFGYGGMVPFPPERAHSSPPRILSRIAHVFWEFCRDCIDCGRLSPLGGNVAFSAFQSSSFLCNPPFPPYIRSPLRNPTPIFSVSLNSSRLCCPNRTTKPCFAILRSLLRCNPLLPSPPPLPVCNPTQS